MHANVTKFKPVHLDYMLSYASELIEKFGYQDLFEISITENASGVPIVHYRYENALE